ncbi:MAG: GntR family transcriptional regulator [Corynebacterium sp.]|uniref:GntR family transcriptional regulator n=1 Tax=Corynebacterium sp. TaxID=1720 RepID=UPI0026E08FCE|nr:GntR family transcriptional regulator [Corynebacterium sp.]MDO5669076.1 GntR family transcriptional regulator [Corynebacterium sp.]
MNSSSRRLPAYQSIADELRSRIERRELTGGDKLPTERELVQEFGVARMTVRHALDILQLEGLIERRRGRTGGTFVRSVPPVVELTRMEGLMPQLREHGLEVSSEILESNLCRAGQVVAEALGIGVNDPVFQIVRVRSVNAVPLIVESSYFPSFRVPGMLDADLSRSMYELLDAEWDLRPVRKSETIIPGVASSWEQEILGITRNLPLLRISRTASTADGQPIEYSEDVLRSDIAHIRVVTDTQVSGR